MSDNGNNGTDGGDDRDEEASTDGDRDEDSGDRSDREESTDESVGSVTLSLDATLELLANHDRRAIISYLRDATRQTATADELADHLVERRAARTGERPGRSHVLSTLHHIHLPKLVDAGVVDYDARRQEVRYWGSERLETWHERIEARDGD
ncbi:hypothetical protein M0R89_11235 [Halorussus limi]|uniref:DUF7344 domain-containing protein n=1 Tax=Halorussus limi TaxID=2938695 RepID=A0A8U0HQI3_9EURY|nr:hypothetical protein [Halorussus limi]UPV73121.1 hypothetical protein M0R89_11235 [Halorussus limi]